MELRKILLVDDDPDIVETLRFRLEREGYEVATAADGVEALGMVRTQHPDLVILDVMMPKENGYRVSKMIKEDEQTGRPPKVVPVILLTARNLSGDPEREATFREFSHADAIIYKPFEMEDLIEQIRAFLSR